MENFVFNPINNKTPSGASSCNVDITYTLKISKFIKFSEVYFAMHKDGQTPTLYPMSKAYADDKYFYMQFTHAYSETGFYWYHFEVKTIDNYYILNRSENLDVTISNIDNDYLQLIISKESNVDSAYKKGIIYHIFVDRFNKVGEVKARNGLKLTKSWNDGIIKEYNEKGERVNQICFGGNFAGIIEKLDYLKSLNVSTIYLSPIMEANSNHKYDVADYSKIDSMFGDQDTFELLVKKAKRMGMSIIIDGVFNHTGSDSVYFNKLGRYRTVGAYQSKNSKYYSWYSFEKYPDEYSCWWGIKTLPQTEENSGFFDYIAGRGGIIEKYMAMGITGFRLDVVDELTNNFLHEICNASRRVNPKAFMIGEVWEDASSKISYSERKEYFLGGNLDSVTNYPMKNAILEFVKFGRVDNFVNTINLIKDQYPKSIQNNLMNIIDTHDTIRALTYLGANLDNFNENEDYRLSDEEKSNGIKLLKLATTMQYTIMGLPTIYYGDEAGIEGTKDPYCRRPYPWGKEDLTLIEWYKKLGQLRNNSVFDGGELNIKYAENGVLIYERVKGTQKVYVIINASNDDFEFVISKTMCNFFSDEHISGKIICPSKEAIVLM